MSFLFNKKSQKVLRWIWIGCAALIILSLVAGLFAIGANNLGV